MKISKKLSAIILVIAMISGVLTSMLVVSAATEKSLKTDNTYVKVSANGYYKITVKEEGCLTVTVKCSGSKSYSDAGAEFIVLNSKKKDFSDLWSDYDGNVYIWGKGTKSETISCAVSKGTYYVKISDFSADDGGSVNIKSSFKAVTQPTNYCVAKAAKLEKGKTITMYQTQGYSFDRWFKIVLASNQKVNFTISEIDDIDMFDQEGNSVNVKYVSSGKYQTAKIAKGTYYVCAEKYSTVAKTAIQSIKWS